MTIIRRTRARLFPRDAYWYFAEHHEDWEALKAGAEISIPDDIFEVLPKNKVEAIEPMPVARQVVRPRVLKPSVTQKGA